MNFDVDKKSLLIGIAAGFSVAILVLSLIILVVRNIELQKTNQALAAQVELQKFSDIPVKKAAVKDIHDENTQKDEIKAVNPTAVITDNIIDNSHADKTVAEGEITYEEFPKHDIVKVSKDVSLEIKKQAKQAEMQESLENAPLYVKNAQKFTVDTNKKLIAIVIDDLGVHTKNSQYSADKLPLEVTFAYLPYGSSTQSLIKQEHSKGREAMLHLPAEAFSPIDPGPDALYANMTRQQIEKTTYKNLNQVIDYVVGANNHMGSKFTASLEGMKPVLEIMDKEKMFFMDSFTSAKTQVSNAKKQAAPNLPLLTRHVFLDHERTSTFINKQLKQTQKIADKKGYAIAIGHPHKVTTQSILEWYNGLDKSKYQLVPISAIVKTELKK